jgi:hypothetical protein
VTPQTESIEQELARRHRSATIVVGACFCLTIALVVIAVFSAESLRRPGDPSLAMALWITILIFGLGSFALRRARFQPMRLQDIAALRGPSGMLAALQGTTIQIALIGLAIALMGFIVMIISPSDNRSHMLRAGGVAVIVLVYSYPQRKAWQRVLRAVQESGDAETSPAKGIVA